MDVKSIWSSVANRYELLKTRLLSDTLSDELYGKFGGLAKNLRTIAQFLIGSYVFLIVVIKPVLLFWNICPQGTAPNASAVSQYLACSPILLLVGHALAFSAAVELAYMLFTAELDEAIDPLIIGIASASLVLISDEQPESWSEAIFILFAAISLFILFRLRPNRPKEQGRNETRDT